jgi:hypothetical protein
MSMAKLVVSSFDSPAGDYCVDIFMRDDGTFGSGIPQGR